MTIPQISGLEHTPEYEMSLILPAYNEASREAWDLSRHDKIARIFGHGRAARPDEEPGYHFRRAINGYQSHFSRIFDRFQLIVVDDGSTDNTSELAASLGATVHTLEQNVGRGGALKAAFTEVADGEAEVYADADMSYGNEDVEKVVYMLHDGADVAIAYRDESAGSQHESRLRKVGHEVARRHANKIHYVNAHDPQAGLKGFTHDAAKVIWPLVQTSGWSADPEAIIIAEKFGFDVVEVPTNVRPVKGSRVKVVKDLRQMFHDRRVIGEIHDNANYRG